MNSIKKLSNKPITRLLVIPLVALAFCRSANAVPYASGLTNDAGTVKFTLNESADNVKVLFDSGSSTNDLGAKAKGSYTFTLGAATNYQIVVSKTTPLGWTQTSTDANVLNQFYSAKGVAINLNPTNTALFGRTYVANSLQGTTTVTGSRPCTDGIYVLNADQTDPFARGNTAATAGIAFDGGTTTPGGASSPYRIELGPDNALYIADYSTNTGTVYRTDPDVTTNAMVLQGQGVGQVTSNPGVHTEVAAIIPRGSLESGNLVLYGIDGHFTGGLNAVFEWDINAGPFPYNAPPTQLAAGRLGVAHLEMDLDIGPDGKFYTSINRLNGTDTDSIRVYDTDGFTLLWGSLTKTGSPDQFRTVRGIKVSPDGKTLAAIRDDNQTLIIPLTNGIPDIGAWYVLATYPTTSTVGRDVAWDAGGNLYVVSSGREVMRVFSPGGTTVATTGDDGSNTNGTFSLSKVVVDPAIISQPQSQTLNAGLNATFNVQAGGTTPFSYQWTFAGTNIGGATLSAYTRSNVQTNFAGNYQVIITNSVGAITSSVAVLTVNGTVPIITTQPVGITNAAGTSPKFTVVTTGSDPRTYQWRFNGANIAAATTTAFTQTNAQTNNTGQFSVVITNPLGAVTSSVVNLLITNSAPVFNAQPKSQTVNAGVNVTFTTTLSAASTNNLAYQWSLNGVQIAGATATSYVTNNVQLASSGSIYTVRVTNLFGTINSTNAVLTVNDVAPILGVQPKSQTNGVGSNLVFTVTTTAGTDPRTYQWQFNGADILDATNTSLTLTNLQFTDAGTYSVYVVNPINTTTSTNAILTLTNRAPIITLAPASVSTNAGSTAAFTVNANGATNLTYQWSFAGNNLATGTASTLTLNNVQLANAGFYTVVVGSGAGTYFTTNSVAQLAVTVPSTVGTGTGVRGDYYTVQAQTFTNAPTLTRIDTNIDFNFGTGSPAGAISTDRFTVRWTGQVQPLYSQDYTFYTRSDDGARLWVNGQLLINHWVGQSVTEWAATPVALTAGQKYDVLMEYFEGTSTAEVHLNWSSLSQIKQAIPMSQLYPEATGSAITPTLSSSFNGASAVFDWTGSYILQTAVAVDGPYTNLTTLGVGPYTNTLVADPQRYFRLKAN